MKLFTFIIAAVIGTTFIGINPVAAQANGGGYEYNSVPNGYGSVNQDYTQSSVNDYQSPSNCQPGLQRNIRYAPGYCSTYVNC